ncbi:thymidine phosphorylase [Ketogulonicigenium robustum]|uniref:Thymidine phosphorylase n=1 Tax=Ketogulonicigenium robustum TaxID=92947 RepID=A0A1W6P0T7_9RHOB|nr:thymidine phosphorylase [Ketogulonicigenium robustum]ARO15122.1 thymidine phosphorylase [Ketogulonicigenium robustum]
MDARGLIVALRDGQDVSAGQVRAFALGLADGRVSDAQAGAFAMAVLLRGLGPAGRVALTEGMRDSGDTLRWDLDRPVLDKHSTGGIGDCVSLVLAPALAACGVAVPMISGRGLGHSGGTLDKLEAIPGLSVAGDEARLRGLIDSVGCAIVGASGRIAPADKRLYAIRDVSGTVESLDLITASILSKKLAAGLQGLVLDVKVGSGAFMRTMADAEALAKSLVATANGAGCPTAALITDMNQPLAPAMGNALEVRAALDALGGQAGRLRDVTLALGARLLALAGQADGAARLAAAIDDGRALDVFGRMVAAQGGPVDFVENAAGYLPVAPVVRDIAAPHGGVIAGFAGVDLGLAVVALGGGRRVETDRIDPAVGYAGILPLGTEVQAGQPVAQVHAASVAEADAAATSYLRALTVGDAAPQHALILGEVA